MDIVKETRFLSFVMKHPDFVSGKFDTNFVNKNWHEDGLNTLVSNDALVAAWLVKKLLTNADTEIKFLGV